MSLLRFTSCRGADKPAPVWIESSQVALIVPQREIDPKTNQFVGNNITAIFLHSGVKAHIMESSVTVASDIAQANTLTP